jgi:hypothetical protein
MSREPSAVASAPSPNPPMGVRVEVFPIAADATGIWLLSFTGAGPIAWRSGLVPADGEVHEIVRTILAQHESLTDALLIHSTSWREDNYEGRNVMVVTYMAVLRRNGDLVPDEWPLAAPIGPQLMDHMGNPFPHSPVEPPTPRHYDVLIHGLRHLAFLLNTDDSCRPAFDEDLRHHLTQLDPALAGLYDREQRSA